MDSHDTGIIDTHCHLWRLELAWQQWIKPNMTLLYRTFEPADLAATCAEVGVIDQADQRRLFRDTARRVYGLT